MVFANYVIEVVVVVVVVVATVTVKNDLYFKTQIVFAVWSKWDCHSLEEHLSMFRRHISWT